MYRILKKTLCWRNGKILYAKLGMVDSYTKIPGNLWVNEKETRVREANRKGYKVLLDGRCMGWQGVQVKAKVHGIRVYAPGTPSPYRLPFPPQLHPQFPFIPPPRFLTLPPLASICCSQDLAPLQSTFLLLASFPSAVQHLPFSWLLEMRTCQETRYENVFIYIPGALGSRSSGTRE